MLVVDIIRELSSEDYAVRQRAISAFNSSVEGVEDAIWNEFNNYKIDYVTSIIKISSTQGYKWIDRLLYELDTLVADGKIDIADLLDFERHKRKEDFTYLINSLMKYVFRASYMGNIFRFYNNLSENNSEWNPFWYCLLLEAEKRRKISLKYTAKFKALINKPYGEEYAESDGIERFFEKLYNLNRELLSNGRRRYDMNALRLDYKSKLGGLISEYRQLEIFNYDEVVEYIFFQLGKSKGVEAISNCKLIIESAVKGEKGWKKLYLDDIIYRMFSRKDTPLSESELSVFFASTNLSLQSTHFKYIKAYVNKHLFSELVESNYKKQGLQSWSQTKSAVGLYWLAVYKDDFFLESLSECILDLSTRILHQNILHPHDYSFIYSLLARYFSIDDNKELINLAKRQVGILWEQLAYKILSAKYEEVYYQVELDEYSRADIAVNQIKDNFYENIYECKKSTYFLPENLIEPDGSFDFTKYLVAVNKYIGFSESINLLILEKSDIRFKCPKYLNIIYAEEWLESNEIDNIDKSEIKHLLQYCDYLELVRDKGNISLYNNVLVSDVIRENGDERAINIIDGLEILADAINYYRSRFKNKDISILNFEQFKQQGGI